MHRFHAKASLAALAVTATTLFAMPAQANLISNGGFETGDFTNWTLSGNTGFGTGVCLSGSNFLGSICSSNSGQYAAVSGPSGTPGFISQTMSTVIGNSYDVEFYYRNDNLNQVASNAFNVNWNGSAVTAFANEATHDFTKVSLFTLLATSTTTTLSFELINNPGGFFIDDVAVVDAVPEPSGIALAGVALLSLFGFGLLRRRMQD